MLILNFNSEKDTKVFADKLASIPEIQNIYLSLNGNLGAGKTTLTRYLLKSLGVTGRIKSPTFALMETYLINNLDIYHFDFYRIENQNEWSSESFKEIFLSIGLKISEWSEKVNQIIPKADLEIFIQNRAENEKNENFRQLRLIANSQVGQNVLEKLNV